MKKRRTIKIPGQTGLSFLPEEIADNFCGGGGASEGIRMALGRDPNYAINHDPEAIAMHVANHPGSAHFCNDVFAFDPNRIKNPLGLAWFSPDCKHFSKAKGGKPVEKKIRDLAWVVIKWARSTAKPRVIILENVEEFQSWGPLKKARDGKYYPDPDKAGLTFRIWLGKLKAAGYHCDWRELIAYEYGAPTTRKRFFLIARCDKEPIQWPEPTHGKPSNPKVLDGTLKPWRTAWECIDRSIPCPSIFERKKPLAPATMRRIANGIRKFVMESGNPFIVPITHTTSGDRAHPIDEPVRAVTTAKGGELMLCVPSITKFRTGATGHAMDEPLHTITAGSFIKRPGGDSHALGMIAPTLIQTSYGERPGQEPRSLDLFKPLGTMVSTGKHALVAAFLAQHNGGENGHQAIGQEMERPLSTIAGNINKAVVTSNLVKLKGTSNHGQPVDEPIHTIQAGGNHYAEVRSFLIQYYSQGSGKVARSLDRPAPTVTTKHRLGIVTLHGVDYQIVDIGMRMLQPHELFAAQGFRPDYEIAPMVRGKYGRMKRMTKTAQIRCCGNSVCPPLAEAIVRANFRHEEEFTMREAA